MGGVTTSLPTALVVVVTVVMPLSVALFFGLFAFKGIAPLVYRCRRCGRDFLRSPLRKFPTACRRCGAHDWNAPP
jgi:hypothetical protein